MDLRTFPGSTVLTELDEEELLSLWWYQPYIFSDDIVSGMAPQWSHKGIDRTIFKRSEFPKQFDRFADLCNKQSRMYQDWAKAVCELAQVNPSQASVFEIACNSGYFLYWFKQQGARQCVGIDQSKELDRQRTILSGITQIDDIDFRPGRWSSQTHSIDGLRSDERFDIVICSAFAQHVSDPLHLIQELASRTSKVLLLFNLVGYFNFGMRVRYLPMPHHEKWGDEFPNNFDTRVSRKLLRFSLNQCGFRKVIQLPYSRKWLPWSWYRAYSTLVCIK